MFEVLAEEINNQSIMKRFQKPVKYQTINQY